MPLYGLRWCAIILGELCRSAGNTGWTAIRPSGSWDQVRRDQIDKARELMI